MQRLRRYLLRSTYLRRLVGIAVLLPFVVTAAGVPLPSFTGPTNSGELYPCAASGCGCDSAEHCWRSCCCHSLAERMNWARRHGVRPPAFAVANARAAGLNVSWLGEETPVRRIATSKPCCVRSVTPSKHACCAHQAGTQLATPSVRKCCVTKGDHAKTQEDGSHFVAWRAMKCRGDSLNWLAAVPILISTVDEFSPQLLLLDRLGPTTSDIAESLSADPAVPPPERA